jgi:putative tryptophan/tyrosine transport system substrate-binding protein
MSGSAVPETFRRRLRQHGYVEGKNLILGARGMDLRLERLPDLAEELVRLGVDVIATQTTPAALAATAGELKVRGDG